MKKAIICMIGLAMMAACGHKMSREEMIKTIEEHEQTFEIDLLNVDTTDNAPMEMVTLYRQFYKQFPNDSLTPVYMQRAADINISLGNADGAVALLDSIITLHPDYADVAGCWFLKGYAYETAENFDAAREAYTHFVDNYPDHYLAKDTRTTLQYLGLSPEEMFEAIMSGATDENLVME